MADFIHNLYVSAGTGRPGGLTNVQLPEVQSDFGRRNSKFVPYSSLYHAVYPQKTVSEGRRHKLYRWSVVAALVLLLGVVVAAGLLLFCKNTALPPPTHSSTITSSVSSINVSSVLTSGGNSDNTSGKGGSETSLGNTIQDHKKTINLTFTDSLLSEDLLSVDKTC